MAKKVHVLMIDDGREKGVIAVFRKKPSDKKLASIELAEGWDTVEGIREAFQEHLFWDTAYLY